jgi:hypothetical protein
VIERLEEGDVVITRRGADALRLSKVLVATVLSLSGGRVVAGSDGVLLPELARCDRGYGRRRPRFPDDFIRPTDRVGTLFG